MASPRMRIVLRSVALAASLAAPIPARAGPESSRAQAIDIARHASEAYSAGRFAEALAGFERAFRTYPAPPLLLDLSRTEIKLGRCDRALHYAASYSTAPGVVREQADKWKAHLEDECIAVTVESVPPAASVWIDSVRQSMRTPWTGRLTPGHHSLLLWQDGYAVTDAAVDVAPGTTRRVSIPLAQLAKGVGTPSPPPFSADLPEAPVLDLPIPPPEPSSHPPPGAAPAVSLTAGLSESATRSDLLGIPAPRSRAARLWAGGLFGTAGAALIAGGVFGGLSLQAAAQRNADVLDPPAASAAQGTLTARATTANVLFGIGAVAAVASGFIWFGGDAVFHQRGAAGDAP